MNEFILEPNCVVYQNCIDDVEKVLETIVKSKDITKEGYFIEPWYQWGSSSEEEGVIYGEKSSFLGNNTSILEELMEYQKNGSEEAMQAFDERIKVLQDQLNSYNKIRHAILECLNKYIYDHAQSESAKGFYPEYVDFTKLDFAGKKIISKDLMDIAHPESIGWDGKLGWSESRFDILKHNGNTDRQYAIGWHTDRFEGLDKSPGPKHILTATLYLNDDCDGGEVAFLRHDMSPASVTVYKPKAGDITVFPSSSPFFHAAMPVKSNRPKYFIRFFYTWGYEGSSEWYENAKKYGKDVWIEMERDRVQKELTSGVYRRHIFFPDDYPISGLPATHYKESYVGAEPLYVSNLKYINGSSLQN